VPAFWTLVGPIFDLVEVLEWRCGRQIHLHRAFRAGRMSAKAGLEMLKPAAENVLQKWPVSKRVNSSRAPDDDPTLIDKIAI
jgi:hypothetical protein